MLCNAENCRLERFSKRFLRRFVKASPKVVECVCPVETRYVLMRSRIEMARSLIECEDVVGRGSSKPIRSRRQIPVRTGERSEAQTKRQSVSQAPNRAMRPHSDILPLRGSNANPQTTEPT